MQNANLKKCIENKATEKRTNKGLIMAGCSLKLVSAPDDVLRGAVTSLSIFNPFKITGFNTGSSWTMHLYKP